MWIKIPPKMFLENYVKNSYCVVNKRINWISHFWSLSGRNDFEYNFNYGFIKKLSNNKIYYICG